MKRIKDRNRADQLRHAVKNLKDLNRMMKTAIKKADKLVETESSKFQGGISEKVHSNI